MKDDVTSHHNGRMTLLGNHKSNTQQRVSSPVFSFDVSTTYVQTAI